MKNNLLFALCLCSFAGFVQTPTPNKAEIYKTYANLLGGM